MHDTRITVARRERLARAPRKCRMTMISGRIGRVGIRRPAPSCGAFLRPPLSFGQLVSLEIPEAPFVPRDRHLPKYSSLRTNKDIPSLQGVRVIAGG